MIITNRDDRDYPYPGTLCFNCEKLVTGTCIVWHGPGYYRRLHLYFHVGCCITFAEALERDAMRLLNPALVERVDAELKKETK